MSKNYVPKTLTEFITESKSIPLKRKYGERPAITAGTNAPIRNQVLSYVAESGSVSKIDLKKFIVGLKEGGATPAAANMFIKRNAKYFITESKNGVTYFKLSNLGQRLVNQFVTSQEGNVSEAVKDARTKMSAILESVRKENKNTLNEDEETPEFEVPEDEEPEDMDNEGPAAEIGFDDDEEDFGVEQEDEEGEEGGKVAELEARIAELEAQIAELMDLEKEEHPELRDEEDDEDFDGEGASRPHDEPRDHDFKDKGRPGLHDMNESVNENSQSLQKRLTHCKETLDTLKQNKPKKPSGSEIENRKAKGETNIMTKYRSELSKWNSLYGECLNKKDDLEKKLKDLKESTNEAMTAQFVSHKLAGKKASKLGGKLDAKLHNMLDDNQDKDDKELDSLESELTKNGASTKRIKAIIENLRARSVNEAEESDEADELKDEDLDSLDTSDETPEERDETATTLDGEEEVEKVEITEFIITVDDPDIAIEELSKLGVTAERVEAEPKEEEVPAEVEEEPADGEEKPAEGETGDEEGVDIDLDLGGEASESLRAFIMANYLTEAEEGEEKPAEEIGTSDELGLGDQGQEATELQDKPEGEEEPLDATTEFEENKIKVKAEDWDVLKGWLEEKGVDVKEMFGGDIETEEIDPEEVSAEIEEPKEEISDDDIDFSGIGDKDETKIKDKKEEKPEKKANESVNESLDEDDDDEEFPSEIGYGPSTLEVDWDDLTAIHYFDWDDWDSRRKMIHDIEAFAEGHNDMIGMEFEEALEEFGYCIDYDKPMGVDETDYGMSVEFSIKKC